MNTVYIVALCFDEEFHNCVTDTNGIKGVFTSKEIAEEYIAKHYSKELAAIAYDKEWPPESARLYETLKDDLNSRNTKKQATASEVYSTKQLEYLVKYGFADQQEYYKYHGITPRIFETTLY